MESNDEDFGVNPKWACRMANRELASTVESGLSMVFPSLEFGKKKEDDEEKQYGRKEIEERWKRV